MYLKSLSLTGFKSFGKKAELLFATPITAIVGPNGSGKSNVAESFRFVLGEQSIKSMRGKKGEDLIFNGGGGSGARANRASVAVTFDNSSKFLDVDFDEVVLERTVHRDGVNEYAINGSQVRLRDISELLAQANIGSSGHHIISQGEADRILNASHKERRDMIEDALGLKVYQYKRVESEKKLSKTEENIKSVQSLRREIAPHIKFLAKQIEKIERAAEIERRIVVDYKEYLKREEAYLKRERDAIALKKEPLKKDAEALAETIQKAKAVIRESEEESETLSKATEIESRLAELARDKDECARALGRIEGSLEVLRQTLAKQKHTGTVGADVTEKLITEMLDELGRAQEANDLSLVHESIGKLKALLAHFRTTHLQAEGGGEERAMIEKLEQERTEVDEKVRAVAQSEQHENDRLMELRRELEDARSSARESERALFEAMTKHNEVSLALSSLSARSDALARADTAFKRELEETALLFGREILKYPECDLGVSEEEVAGEKRERQEDRLRALERMKIKLEELGGGGGDDIRKEYEDACERDRFLEKEITDLEQSAESLRTLIAELAETLEREFGDGIRKINDRFHDFFVLMFGGGAASIKVVEERKRRRRLADELLDSGVPEGELIEEEETEKGIEVAVSLPRKKIRGLMMLSGGERALTSIALLFAISQVNPPPFIILDETDAALDEANSKKYGDMIESLAKHSQLILITHNRETMSRAGVLYGVTMSADGVSKLLSVQFDEAVAVAK